MVTFKYTPCIELQLIDTNCNDCIHMVRDLAKYKAYDDIYRNSEGKVTNPSYRVNYGFCKAKNEDVSFIPNNCMPQNANCFIHRKSNQ